MLAPIADKHDLFPVSYSKVPILYSLPQNEAYFIFVVPSTHYPLVWSQDLSISDCLSTKLDCVGP